MTRPPTHEHHDQAEQPEWEYAGHQSCRAEIGRLRDEIVWMRQRAERAEATLINTRVVQEACVAAERREIRRLRAALHEVVAQGHWPYCKISVGRCNCAYSDAVEALDPPGPTRPEHPHG